jgi:hypothetical protein
MLILFLNLCNNANSGEVNCHCVILEIPTFYGIGSFIVGFEVLTVVVMKNTIFWDITPCSPLKVNRRVGGTYRLDLQGQRINRARNLSFTPRIPARTRVFPLLRSKEGSGAQAASHTFGTGDKTDRA